MDTYNTFARLGGAGDTLPTDRYIDGLDQTSWLLTDQDDHQESNREAVYYWYAQDFYATRWREFKRFERIMTIGMDVGPSTHGGLFNATKVETSDPSLGWFFNLWSDPKERLNITRTWNIGALAELTIRNKATFLLYPQAPRGVDINGYLLGGPAGGDGTAGFLEALQATLDASPDSQPD